MCLIAVADTARLSHEEIADAARTNQDGIGVAYREPSDRLVSYQKGLTEGEAQRLADVMPLPYVMHFRMATHGGTSPLLCHPFPISRHVGVKPEGQAKELLFHNGIWAEHARFEAEVTFHGPVSDTRILAYVLWREGQAQRDSVATFLATQAGKLALFTPAGITRYGTWEEGTGTDSTPGCWYSNLHHTWSSMLTVWNNEVLARLGSRGRLLAGDPTVRDDLLYPPNTTKTMAPGWNSLDCQSWDPYPEEVTLINPDEPPGTFTCGGCDNVLALSMKEPHAIMDGFGVCHACWAQL